MWPSSALTAPECSWASSKTTTGTSWDRHLAPDDELPPILAEWKAAHEARDLDRLRALYTEDGVFVTTGDVHDLYLGADWALDEVAQRAWSPDGAEFERRALIHSGELDVFDPVEIEPVGPG